MVYLDVLKVLNFEDFQNITPSHKSQNALAFIRFSIYNTYWTSCGRCGVLMVRVLDSGSSGPGSGPGRGHCVVFLGKTLYSYGASLHPGV